MANNARVTLVGTVISEPSNRQTSNGQTVFSMKVGVKTTKKQEGSKYAVSDVYDVSVWGKPGENLIGKVKAKTKVWVCGDQCMGEPWNDREGVTHISPRVNASIVEIMSGGNFQNNNNTQSKQEEDPDNVGF